MAQQTCWRPGVTYGSGTDLFPVPTGPLMGVAQAFFATPPWPDLSWTDAEERAIKPFFTSLTGRVFFGWGLPENVMAALCAMYSRMPPARKGVRDVWVNHFLPELLVSMLPETVLEGVVSKESQNPTADYLQATGIQGIQAFVEHSPDHREVFDRLLSGVQDPELMEQIAASERTKRFLSLNLDKYGHDSIARPAKAMLFLEGVSQHIASAIEWARVGIGIIELSTRFVNMKGAGRYPIVQEILALVGKELSERVEAFLDLCRDAYNDLNGAFGDELRNHWAELIQDENQMKVGVNGEVPDVLGNFIPYCSLTSLAVAVSCEELQQVLKHLRNDATAETYEVARLIEEQATLVGVAQFLRYTTPTPWERMSWTYPRGHAGVTPTVKVGSSSLLAQELKRNGLSLEGLTSWVFSGANQETSSREGQETERTDRVRGSHDKLPTAFEVLSVNFSYSISLRGHRDVKRHVVGRQDRTLLTPYLGFYAYSKFNSPLYTETAQRVCDEGYALYEDLLAAGVPAGLLQYVLPLGCIVAASYDLNARQAEFFCWRRSGSDVNHEVREVALDLDSLLGRQLKWWNGLTRTNRTSGYVFARTPNKVPHVPLPN